MISLFTLFIFFHLINNIVWISKDGNQLLGCETIFYMERAFEIYSQIKPIGTTYFNTLNNLIHYNWSVNIAIKILNPLISTFPVIIVFLGVLLNIPFLSLVYINILFLGAIIILTYFICKEISDKKTGVFAAFLVGFYPFIFGLSRKFSPELALISLVCAAYYFLLKTKDFKHTVYSLLLGLACFLGLIINYRFITFFIAGLIYYFARIFKHRGNFFNLRIINIFFCLIIMLLSSLFLFNDTGDGYNIITNAFKEISTTLTSRSDNFIGNADSAVTGLFLFAKPDDFCGCTQFTDRGMNLRCFSFYLFQMPFLLSPFLWLAFIFGLFHFVKNKHCKEKLVLFLWCIVPYFILSLWPVKWGRFYAPALPAIAIITACGISNMRNSLFKKITITLIILITFCQFFFFTYTAKSSTPFMAIINEGYSSHQPVITNYKEVTKKIAGDIQKNSASKIAVLDILQTSGRFSTFWYNDLTNYIRLLVRAYILSIQPIDLHWGIPVSVKQGNTYDLLIVLNEKDADISKELLGNYTLISKYILIPSEIAIYVYKCML